MIFPNRKKVLVIAISLIANGDSSYRDALNICKITRYKWNADTIIFTDSYIINKNIVDNVNSILIKNRKDFFFNLEEYVKKYSKTHDILFTISAHGYKKYNIDHYDEYIRINRYIILDYEIRNSFYKNMDNSCLSLSLVDTCHSGTMLDLPFMSTDGINFTHVEKKLIIKPKSFCISACNDNELAGEDISYYGGFGGKLICQFLDYLHTRNIFEILGFYLHVREIFINQKYQKSHPIYSITNL